MYRLATKFSGKSKLQTKQTVLNMVKWVEMRISGTVHWHSLSTKSTSVVIYKWYINKQ